MSRRRLARKGRAVTKAIALQLIEKFGHFDSRIDVESVQSDLTCQLERIKIQKTLFFINGRFLNGAQPMEKFVQIIDEELARVAAGGQVSARTE